MAKILTFNGVDQYATFPDYNTLGDPVAYRSVTYQTNNEDGYIIDLSSEPINEFGRVGTDYHAGTLANLRITDSSPIQSTDAMVGDAALYLNLPRMVINGGFAIEFDWRRQAETSDYTLLTGQDALQTATSSIVIGSSDDIVLTDLNGVTATITDGVASIVNGQHCHIKLRAVVDYDPEEGESTEDVNDFICEVDGQETARVSLSDVSLLKLDFSRMGTLPTDMIIQNLRVGTELGRQWLFPLTEGTGTAARNGNLISRSKAYYTNVQPYSNDLTATTGSAPPPPPPPPPSGDRVGVIYYSGAESGAIQPGDAAIDGWRTELPTAHASESLSVVDAPGGKPGKSIRCYYRADWGPDPDRKWRAEIKRPGGLQLEDGQEYWIGWSFYMHDNANNRLLINESLQNASVVQWHMVAPVNDTSQFHMRNGKWVVDFGSYGPPQTQEAVALGVWTDHVMHCKISAGSDGFCKIWRNAASSSEAPIYNRTGPNVPAASPRLNIKLGIYRGGFQAAAYAEQFYDEYRIAIGSGANFASVKPWG